MGASRGNALNAIWPVAMGAAFLSNGGYCVWLMRRHQNFAKLCGSEAARNSFHGALMGLLWMSSNLIYGYGSQALGTLGLTLGWPITMGSVLLTSSGWGFAAGEWKAAPVSAVRWMAAGVLSLLYGVLLLGTASR
jgi:hypothetical protein